MSSNTQKKDEPFVLLDLFIILQFAAYSSFLKIAELSGINVDKWGKRFFSNSRSREHSDDIFNEQSDLEDRIQTAYHFMELEPPVEAEELSKKYKKLSLKYHPDRCGGSEEVRRLMATIELVCLRIGILIWDF